MDFYNFSTISYFFRKSTDPALGSNFFLAASLALSSAAVMLRLRPLPVDGGGDVVVVAGVPLVAGSGEEDAVIEVPLVSDDDEVVVFLVVDTIGTVGAIGATTIGFGDAGGEADEEVTDGILGSGSASSGGGNDFGSSGTFSSVGDGVDEMITFDTVMTSSLVSVTSLVENEAVLTNEVLLKRWPWFLGLVENVDVFDEATVIG